MEVPADKFMGYWPKALKNLMAKVSLPGFRPGQAPEKLVLERVGETTLLQEAAELAISEIYLEIIKAEKLDALGRPEVTTTKLAKDNPLAFTLVTDVYPEIKLPDYLKIAAKAATQPPAAEETKDKRRLDIISAIIKETDLSIPKIMIAMETDRMLTDYKAEISRLGIGWGDYLKRIKKTESELKDEWQDQALERIKFSLIFHEIARAEKLKDPEEVWQKLESKA